MVTAGQGHGSVGWALAEPGRAGQQDPGLAEPGQDLDRLGRANPAATITADPDEDPYWPDDLRREPAVYVHRLVVRRRYTGVGLGAALLDWAGWTARRDHGAQWIRVSAWTTNAGLHGYYRSQGFGPCGFHADDGYPSRARFQKPTAPVPASGPGLFRVSWTPGPRG